MLFGLCQLSWTPESYGEENRLCVLSSVEAFCLSLTHLRQLRTLFGLGYLNRLENRAELGPALGWFVPDKAAVCMKTGVCWCSVQHFRCQQGLECVNTQFPLQPGGSALCPWHQPQSAAAVTWMWR